MYSLTNSKAARLNVETLGAEALCLQWHTQMDRERFVICVVKQKIKQSYKTSKNKLIISFSDGQSQTKQPVSSADSHDVTIGRAHSLNMKCWALFFF